MRRLIVAVLFISTFAVADVRPGISPRVTTGANIQLFTNSSTGADSNDCLSSSTACATLPGACAKIPPLVYHTVTITSATGSTYAAGGCKVQSQLLTNGGTPGSITFTVPLVTATLSSGTATGTATSTSTGTGKTFTVLNDTGNNWPTLGGQYWLTVGGTAYAIVSNTATAITIADSASLGATPAYTIQSAGASITGNTSGTYTDNSGTASSAAFWVSTLDGPAGNTEVTISGFSFSSSVTRAIALWDGRVNLTNVAFPSNTILPVHIYGSGSVRMRAPIMKSTGGQALITGDPGSSPRVISARNSSVVGGQMTNMQGPVAYEDFAWTYVDALATTGVAYSMCGAAAIQLIFAQCNNGAACIDNRGCNASQPASASVAIEASTLTAGANTTIGLVGVAGTGAIFQIDKLAIFGFSTLDASPNNNAQVAVIDEGGQLALHTSTIVTPSSAGGVFCLGLHGAKCWTASQLSSFGGVLDGPDGSVVQYFTGTTLNGERLTPTATGSLPTCQAAPTGGSSTQGLVVHDSTTNRAKLCGTDNTYHSVVDSLDLPLSLANGGTNANLTAVNGGVVYSTASAGAISAAGSSGQCLKSGGAGTPTWGTCTSGIPSSFGTAEALGVVSAATNFTGAFRTTTATGTMRQVTCSWSAAGQVGSTSVTVAVYNATDASTLCTCTLGACNTAANTPLNCDCNTAFLAAKSYTFRFPSTGDCTTAPANAICSVEMTP